MESLLSIFWNPVQRRLRALWRVVIEFSVWFGLQITAGTVLLFIYLTALILRGQATAQELLSAEFIMGLSTQPGFMLVTEVSVLAITLATVWLAGRILDRRPFADFGFHLSGRWWTDFGFGLFLGLLLMAVIFAGELAAGWIQIDGYLAADGSLAFPAAILIPIAVFLCVGISEELNSRGYQLRNLAEGFNGPRLGPAGAIVAATAVSSIVFSFLHAANPNVTLLGILNLIAAGFFLALGYILTGELALPIGLHIAWNFCQGNVFGFPVSGLAPVAARFISIRQGGPDWLTGGAFGPEGGVVGLGAMAIGSVLILLWVRFTRGRITLDRRLAEYEKAEVRPETKV